MKLAAVLFLSLFLVSCASSKYRESSGEYMDNAAISVKIKTKLLANKETKATAIEVESYKGTVILSGFVESTSEREKVLEIARAIDGVKDVKELLIVKSSIVQ